MGARGKLWNPSKCKEARLVVVSVFFLDIKHQIVNPMGIFKFLLIWLSYLVMCSRNRCFWSRSFVDVHHFKTAATQENCSLEYSPEVWMPRSTVVSELISPWQLSRGLRTFLGEGERVFPWKIHWKPKVMEVWWKDDFFLFNWVSFRFQLLIFRGVYIYIYILLTVCWHHPRLMTGSCPTVFQYLLIAIDSMRQGIHFQPLEVSTSPQNPASQRKGKTATKMKPRDSRNHPSRCPAERPSVGDQSPEIQAAKKAEEEREAEAKRHLAGFLRDGDGARKM